jgi:hypothetical protein
MGTARKAPGPRLRAGLWLAVGSIVTLASSAPAQTGPLDAPKPHVESHIQPRQLSTYFPSRPSISPDSTIPIDRLGFSAPGALYLGERNSLASLDFMGEDRLLFTFRVPALLHRQPAEEGDSDEREIRAVVLALPNGTVESEANWLVHDRARYLWMLGDGHFLLRDRKSLVEGDMSLKLTPFLEFPGPLLSVELDPSQHFLVTNSREPSNAGAKAPTAETASTGVDTADTSGANEPDLVLRILQRDSGQVKLVTRVHDLGHLPINEQGYLENLRGDGKDWMLKMNFFTGGSQPMGTVKSTCMPDSQFISDHEVLITACADMSDDALVAMTSRGEKLWIDVVPDRQVWPILIKSAGGQRIARESLYVTHSITAYAPLGDDEIKGQWLQVLDSATGKLAFESPVSPILDAGGNVALSPSGRRVAVLNGGAIQVFELPAPPAAQAAEPNAAH